MRRKMRRGIRFLWSAGAAISFAFSLVCTFLGVAPDQAIEFIIGPKATALFLQFRGQVLGMTPDQARWIFVIIGDVFFAVAAFAFFFVFYANKMAKTYTTVGEVSQFEADLRQQIKESERRLLKKADDLDAKTIEATTKLAQAKKRERRAEKLHHAAREMLMKVRNEKNK